MEEIWKDIDEFNGRYKVSNLGRIMSVGMDYRGHIRKEKILKPKNDGWGYLFVCLRLNNKNTNKKIHVLVAETFICRRKPLMQVDHIDGVKSNNCISNLRWVTRYENYKNEITYKKHPYKEKPVIKKTIDGKYVDEYKSIAEAASINGILIGNISSVCHGRMKTYKGFVWQFK